MQEPDIGQQCIFPSPSSYKEMEKCTLILHAEGKTDYCHLQAALSHFQAMGLYADLELDLTTAQAIEGHDKLFGVCEALSRVKARLRNPAVFMFDRDTKDVKKVSDGSSIIRKWAPGVYSFAIPRPRHRADDRICIEMYYQDVDLRRTDREGRRLFLAKEFNKEDGSHTTEEFYRLYPDRSNLVVEGKVFRKQSGVVGAENKPRKQWALAKAAFADYIMNRIPPFDHVDFRAFREIFNIFEEIVRLESVKEKDHAQTSGNATPPRRTHLLGRERELREITVHLEKSRFVTLVGCGGIGKTLLARRIYASLLDDFGDRAWFISLKDLPASDRQVPNRIPRKIASAIGIKLRQKINPLIALIDILKGNAQLNRRLFIVDNCEHLPAIGKVLSSIAVLSGRPAAIRWLRRFGEPRPTTLKLLTPQRNPESQKEELPNWIAK